MKSILAALQNGRLIELPETDKEKALCYLANIMEAIPDVRGNVAEGVLERERLSNTGIGRGWACPHVRVDLEGELFSVLGWSPSGIDYGSADGEKVHLLVMYYIPNNQRTVYLKELSVLAKAIQNGKGIENIKKADNLDEVRNELLNWISMSIDSSLPQTKARMIKLEAKQAKKEETPIFFTPQWLERVIPFYLIVFNNSKIVLSQDINLLESIEKVEIEKILDNQEFEVSSYKVYIRSRAFYKPDRIMCDCIAIKR